MRQIAAISETVNAIDRDIFTIEDEYKVACAPSNSAAFDDVEKYLHSVCLIISFIFVLGTAASVVLKMSRSRGFEVTSWPGTV